MSKNIFDIIELNNSEILVLPKTYFRPEYYLSDLNNLLSEKYQNISAVYFDFLLKNGTRDRYFKVEVKNKRLVFSSMTSVVDEHQLLQLSNKFFSENLNLLIDSNLTKAQKYSIKRQLAN